MPVGDHLAHSTVRTPATQKLEADGTGGDLLGGMVAADTFAIGLKVAEPFAAQAIRTARN